MQYDPHQTPPSPIEPTGFFNGIQFRPIIGGVIVDTISTLALTTLYYSFFVAKDLAGQGDAAEDAFAHYWSSSDGLVASLVLGSLGTLIGGFYAAYKAGKLEMKHGALVGMGSILLGLVLQMLQGGGQEDNAVPEWFIALSFAAAIPAGALGGFFAEMFKNALHGARPTGGSGWPPPR
jgi:putative membrane protein (TIGR04086 family)